MKKKFGQHFLNNQKTIQKIIDAAEINHNSLVFEVGPGNGSLSKEIIKKNPKDFVAVEIDKSLNEDLLKIFQKTDYKLIFNDALKINEKSFFLKDAILISNLPYNISLALLIKWIYQIERKTWYKKMILMFQKEVADRIISYENSKKFGRISILSGAFFKIKKIIDVKKNEFTPMPKVDSTVLLFEPLKKNKIKFKDIKTLELITTQFFSSRRKKLKKKILKFFSCDEIKKYSLEQFFDCRAENLNKETFYKLTKIHNSRNYI